MKEFLGDDVAESRRTQAFFDAYARDFDAIYGTRRNWVNRVLNPWLRRSMALRFERTLAGCQPTSGASVLDVGCGPGHYGVALAKRGAERVVGIDFAPNMIQIARDHAVGAGVEDICKFEEVRVEDFRPHEPFDFVVVNGFMDYVADASDMIERLLSWARVAAFFSFPAAGGILGWQRQLRYRRRCDLFLYRRSQLEHLFRERGEVTIEPIARDFFVSVRR